MNVRANTMDVLDWRRGSAAGARLSGFALPEVLVGVFLLGFVVLAFYSAFTQGTIITRMAREDLRATQILLESSEALRLCGWEHLPGVPATVPAFYDPATPSAAAQYTVTTVIQDAPMAYAYGNNLKQAVIRVDWTTGKLKRQRELITLVARYGLQTYVD